MNKRWDVCAPRPGREKTFWHRVGTAFEGKSGIGIVFDSLPLPDKEGRVSVQLFEPREKGASPPARTAPRSSGHDDMDDEIPFR
jgi:hypothetical protein